MQIQVDSNNNKFFQFKNVRVSVKHTNEVEKDFAGTGRCLQILAYRDDTMSRTYPGPQIPIESELSDEQILAVAWGMLNAGTNKL